MNLTVDFPLILSLAVIITGIIWFVDKLYLKPKRQVKETPKWIEYSGSFFPVLLLVLVIRSFIMEPFRIPSGSLEPTLKVGDFILVNKYDYGLRLPVLGTKILPIGEPKVGDIVVFHWPANPAIDFIKRVIGVPGDHISYINKVLYINGKKMPQTEAGYALDTNGNGPSWKVADKIEDLNGIKHGIYLNPQVKAHDFKNIVVPKGEYFMMGDNRDNSEDSRYWGFVPQKDLVGKAVMVWLSWDGVNDSVRWHRIGKSIN